MECGTPMKIRTLFMTGLTNATNLLGSGGWQTKKLVFVLVALASIVWLSVDLKHGITTEWNVAFGLLLGFATGGYLGGKKVSQGNVNVEPKE